TPTSIPRDASARSSGLERAQNDCEVVSDSLQRVRLDALGRPLGQEVERVLDRAQRVLDAEAADLGGGGAAWGHDPRPSGGRARVLTRLGQLPSGMSTRMSVPRPGALATRRTPPTASTRSRRPWRPEPCRSFAPPTPSSPTSMRRLRPDSR